jgi:ribose transport system ATP-binding protein
MAHRPMADRVVLEVRDLTKRFPGVVALDGVSLSVRAGEVHALVGENGAGKSTLIRVVTGAYGADGGQVLLDGDTVSFSSPRESQAAGISTIYQEINLIPLRSVAENIFLGREHRNRFGLLDRTRMNTEAAELLSRFGISVDVTAPLRSLGLGSQQMVAIARAVSEQARVVIMDEPTSSLESREVDVLFRVIRQLSADGVAVVYVSHRLDELYELCQRLTVLRDGKVVHTGPLQDLSRAELIAAMLGRDLEEVTTRTTGFAARGSAGAEHVLEAEGLTREHLLHDVSLAVRAGEIVGLSGLLGSGRTETAKAIFGAMPVDEGTVKVKGADVPLRGPASAIRNGVAFLAEDRKAEGIIPDLSVRENIVTAILPRLARAGIVSERAQDRIVETFMKRLAIKASSPDQPVRELSGGNQQKVLLARWLCLEPEVLLLDEPTRGIDVGAKAEVQGLINELAAEGLGVLFISSEMEELVEGCDRVVVLREGAVVGELTGEGVTEPALVGMLAHGDAVEPADDGAQEARGE